MNFVYEFNYNTLSWNDIKIILKCYICLYKSIVLNAVTI